MSDNLVCTITDELALFYTPTQQGARKTRTYAEDLIALAELTAQVSRSSGQDEGDEDALTIFAPHNVEAEAGGAALHANSTGFAGIVVLSHHAAGDRRVAARRRRG